VGRGKAAKTIQLRDRARDILHEIQPATVRAVCYRLFSEGLIPDMSISSTKRMSSILTEAREEGVIPWEHLVDNTRVPHRARVFETPRTFSDAVKRSYQADPWEYQSVRVEVWSEKDTVSGVLHPVLDKLKVTFRVNRGFTSATVINDIAEEVEGDPRPFVALYVGDYDPSGLYMSEVDLPRRLEEYGATRFAVERVALVEADLHPLRRLSFPVETKAADPRYRWYVQTTSRNRGWELDALDPNALRARVRTAIERYIEPVAWERVMVAERAVQRSLDAAMRGWAGKADRVFRDQSGNAAGGVR